MYIFRGKKKSQIHLLDTPGMGFTRSMGLRSPRMEFTNTFRGGRRSRFGREHQRRVVGDDRTALQVPFVRVHVIGAPLEPAAGEGAQISGQTPFSRHEVQPHFELLLEFFLQINRRAGGGGG